MDPKLDKTEKLELKNQLILTKRREYFNLASAHQKCQSELPKCQKIIGKQQLKVYIVQIIKFCVYFHIELFKDFMNGNLGLAEFQESLLKVGKAHLLSLEKEHGELCYTYALLKVRINRLECHRAQAYGMIEIIEKQLRGVKTIDRMPLQGFGKDMVKLCSMIEKSSDFKKKPKGPIGNCITVQLPNWTGLVENILKPFIAVFLVDNPQDGDLLTKFIDIIYGANARTTPSPPLRPDVWVTKFTTKALDISKSKVVNDTYPTLLDILNFEEVEEDGTAVRNFLIQYGRIEKTLLFNTQHEAFPILAERDALPKNCIVAYTLDAYKIKPAPAFQTRSLGLNSLKAKILRPTTPDLDSILKKFHQLEDEVEDGVNTELKIQKDLQLALVLHMRGTQRDYQLLKKALAEANVASLSLDAVLTRMPAIQTMDFETSDFSYIDIICKNEMEKLEKIQKLDRALKCKIKLNETDMSKLEQSLAISLRGKNMRNRIYSV